MLDTATVNAVLDHVDAGLDQSLERLQSLLRIKSISTDPAFSEDCKAAARWLADDLIAGGFTASIHHTPGHPIVVAHDDRDGPGPHVLFYGHYDVQPVDPLDLWSADPFEPHVKTLANGIKVITGRGASDDKGQLMTFIEACRAWRHVAGELPVRVSLLLEGEEESGGKNLPIFIEANAEELSADIALVCDTDMWDRQTPCVTTMLRGFVGEEITVACANRDLHSGIYGGAARNPNHLLAEIIASLHHADGRVALEGFYDDVVELPARIKEQWIGLGFDENAFLASAGLSIPAGERDRSVLEMLWSRPTCEINGMTGGYVGEGFKTVIPAKASAKISFRLVSDMDPRKIRESFRAHVRARIPADCSVTFADHGGSPALTVPLEGSFLDQALAALTREWGKPAVIIGDGGSIPVGGEFKRILGIETLFIGFAQNDDRVHSPDEKYDLASFHKGIRSWVRLLDAFAK
ncbi:M20/M25/M40 family metallo-hydrolase [Agrobacterium tumefaciens]|jgi:acetylornithine deacetylase/succinyl-diaminopimelate desuccinylase-like protein|uniref:M20/M25/M40 family metallo-hydrolase n=1 Tax=Agrobacterium tumefaciens TaxID=358 RepID=UPI000DD7C7CD|nr:M20/M25/M40 family metallo-hydrolase [Agrobacterium tumefaciens]MDR6591544.1 acetylornithine deacetylase/succinyl-diaminopimelate desuccinylase-like protein [Agrobacterium tumefaciens]